MKIVDTGETKMVNAIMHFANSVKYPYKIKIFKLLHFLDFIHFSQVGIPVTNQSYKAFERGPVPIELYNDIEKNTLSSYFLDNIKIMPRKFDDKEAFEFRPKKKKPNMEVFTPREIEIIKNLSLMYKNATADEMTEASHLKNLPWSKTVKEKGLHSDIDYFLAIDESKDISNEVAKERYESTLEMKKIFGHE